MQRGPRIGPSIEHRSTSTWGRRETIRPGVDTGAGGTGIGPDIGVRKRLLDVRVETDRPGVASRPMVVYVTARCIFDPSFVAPAASFARDLLCVLETGSGGNTREEQFVLPQHGRAIHIGADSIRLYVVYLPLREQPPNPLPDSLAAMTGFEVTANCSISQLDIGEVRVETTNFENPPAASSVQAFDIPAFSETLRIDHPAAALFDVVWTDIFGNTLFDFGVLNGLDFAEPKPIPVQAARVQLTYNGGGGPIATGAALLQFFRPS